MAQPEEVCCPECSHHFTLGDGKVKGYLTTGEYEDGRLGEIFVKMQKQGGRTSGFVDCWAIAISMLLQTGTALEDIIRKFKGQRFEPSGRLKGEKHLALSPVDYIVRYLEGRYLDDGS